MNKTDLIGKRVNVLDKGWVELLGVMGDDSAIVEAARVSFLGESKGDEADKKLLFRLMKDRHTSPFEMGELKFRIHAPLVCLWHLVRHRTFSICGQSGRYVPFTEGEFYTPTETQWRKQSKSNKQASDGFIDQETGATLTRELLQHYETGYRLYEHALGNGVAREQARLFLAGFSVYYTFVVKTDIHNLLHFFSLRLAHDAQYEIRTYAETMYHSFFKPLFSWTAEAWELGRREAEERAKPSYCEWKREVNWVSGHKEPFVSWQTGCEMFHQFNDGDIQDHCFTHCPYCGKAIKETDIQ